MMPTTPYASTTPDLLPYAHAQVVRMRATHPTWTGAVDLTDSLKDWTLTFDESRAPRVELHATIPDDAALATTLDPRIGVRVEVDAGYLDAAGTEDAYTIADLGLRAVRRSVGTADLLELTAASDEALVIDASPAVTGAWTGTPANIIAALITASISPRPKITITATGGASATLDPVTDRWTTIDDLADQITADVYDNGLREWVIAPRVTAAATTPDLTIIPGTPGTLIAADRTAARDEWANYVTVRYRWRSGTTDNEVLATAYAASGDYLITGPSGKRSLIFDRTTPTTQAAANAAAATLLARSLTRGRSVTVTTISAYWIRPGSTLAIRLPGDTAATPHLVSSVMFRADGAMTAVCRVPDPSPVIGTTTPVGGATADPTPAAAQTYTSTWVASSSKTYASDGTARTDTDNIVQGYTATWGDQRALVAFTGANSTGDETGKTITQALNGATVSRIALTLTNVHWYYFAGGTARVDYSNRTSLPATFASPPTPTITAGGWAKYATRTVVITSPAAIAAFLAGTARAVQLGPAGTTDQHYYGRFAGATEPNPPKLTITYAR